MGGEGQHGAADRGGADAAAPVRAALCVLCAVYIVLCGALCPLPPAACCQGVLPWARAAPAAAALPLGMRLGNAAVVHGTPECNNLRVPCGLGMCRGKHWDVLEWLLFLNTHDEVTYRTVHGDKVRCACCACCTCCALCCARCARCCLWGACGRNRASAPPACSKEGGAAPGEKAGARGWGRQRGGVGGGGGRSAAQRR